MNTTRRIAFTTIAVFIGLLPLRGQAAADISTPEEAIAAVVEAYRADADIRGRLQGTVGDRIEVHSIKAWKAADDTLANLKQYIAKTPHPDRPTLYYSRETLAGTERAWRVRVQDLVADWRLTFYVDSRSRRIIVVRSAPTPYL